MKRFFLLLFAIITLSIGCAGCKSADKKGEMVLYLLRDKAMLGGSSTLQTSKKTDGDNKIDVFDLTWSVNGCILCYEELGEERRVELQVEEIKEIQLFGIPFNMEYEAFITYENGDLPDSWKELFAEIERKEIEKSKYRDKEEYRESRNTEKELSLIQDAFDQAHMQQKAEDWYTWFINATWSHGDLHIRIINATAERASDFRTVILTLIDSEGNEMAFFGSENGYVDAVSYKGEYYAGGH